MKKILIVMLILLAGFAGWYFGRKSPASNAVSGGRKVAFYQSSMHPWIRSDKPGNCTICGMKLTPVYEGEKGFGTDANLVSLSSNAINVVNVQTDVVQSRPIERTLQVAGRIESDETRNRVLSAYVDGRIEKLFVNFTGAEVTAGEPLAVIYSPALLTAEREYLTILAQTNFASSPRLAPDYERLLHGARQRLKRLGMTDEQLDQVRASGVATNSATRIVAPISGTVVKRDVSEGQYVKEGDKLFEISDLSQLWFRFDVYEQDLSTIRIGQLVEVSSPALPGKSFQGPIAFIDPNINEATRSARVRVELQNPLVDGRRILLNGLYATGRIEFKSDPVLAVTRSAVLDPGDHPRVYIDRGGGAYEYRPVQLGRRGQDYIEILDGLEEGDRVVTSGNLLLDSQAQINRSGSSHSDHQHAPETPPTAPAAETEHSAAPGSSPPARINLSPQQHDDLAKFLTAVHGLSQALANDDVQTYNTLAPQLPVPPIESLAAAAAKIREAKAPALDAARVAYLPFSLAVAETARSLRKDGHDTGVKIYKCPMFPRPGKDAFWIQAEGPLRNPFYGSEMLECGTEVK